MASHLHLDGENGIIDTNANHVDPRTFSRNVWAMVEAVARHNNCNS